MDLIARRLMRAGVIIMAAALPAAATTLTIWLKDGRKVEYDTAKINWINFSDSKAQPPGDEEAPVFTEDFRKGLGSAWDPFGVVGGDFQRFARVEPGRLVVRVPEGNSWGKTGIFSKEPFVTVEESPVRIQVELDEKETTGVCIALSAAKDFDIWRQQNVWVTWSKTSETEGSAYFANTQNGAEAPGEIKTGPAAPRTISIVLQAGKAALILADGKRKEGSFGWLKAGTRAYFTVYSHPAREYGPVNLTVDSVKVFK